MFHIEHDNVMMSYAMQFFADETIATNCIVYFDGFSFVQNRPAAAAIAVF
jgi:hypothetical protein